MIKSSCSLLVHAPIEAVWDFISEVELWAPLVSGYIGHTRFARDHVEWKMKIPYGIIKKTVTAEVRVKEWIPPEKISFALGDAKGSFVGCGEFTAKADGDGTIMNGWLSMNPKGSRKWVPDRIFEGIMEEMIVSLSTAIKIRLEQN
ncbi:CoxG family protein [Rossellomorea marisflavi]|uniref:CoxG family protein n=1 Tax=Rossellomorea marisflavi TaxID=189381 RepID=UPI00351643DD